MANSFFSGAFGPVGRLIAHVFEDRGDDPLGERLQQVWQLVLAMAGVTGLGLVVMIVGETAAARWLTFGSLLSFCGFLVVLLVAAFIGGGGVGFIFGIPRMKADPALGEDDPQRRRRALQSNTNLERISDWLTNGIVAVALVKLEELSGVMAAFGHFAETQFWGVAMASIVAQCVVVIGAVLGFIFSYIQTRTALALTFSDTEKALQKLEEVLSKVDEDRIEDPDVKRNVAGLRQAIARQTVTPVAATPEPKPAPAPAPTTGEKFFTDE